MKSSPYNLVIGAGVNAKIKAINAIGSSAASPAGNGAIIPTVPSTPSAPTTSNLGSNVIINWVAPWDGGSTITGYNVVIKQSDGTLTAYTGCTGTAVSCTVPFSVLKAAPYNLANGASVFAKIKAINVIGTSVVSHPGYGAVIGTPSAPSAPTTSNLGSDVIINWVAPADGGSAITGYTV